MTLSSACCATPTEGGHPELHRQTGVQVADVVVGFTHIEKKSRAEIEALDPPAPIRLSLLGLIRPHVAVVLQRTTANKEARLQTLHGIEDPSSEVAAIADLISSPYLRRHLETMDRLDIEYDVLPRESEILHLHFWAAAFEQVERSRSALPSKPKARTKDAG